MLYFFKKIIRIIEYEINFKFVCGNNLLVIGNNCVVVEVINVNFSVKIIFYNLFYNYKVVCFI